MALAAGTVFGVAAMRRAGRGVILRVGEETAVAGIVLNALPIVLVLVWACVTVLPARLESSVTRLNDGCSSLAREFYLLAGKR